MNKKRIIVFAIILLSITSLTIMRIQAHNKLEEARVEQESHELALTYVYLHYALGRISTHPDQLLYLPSDVIVTFTRWATYQPLESFAENSPPNESNIFTCIYTILRMYYHKTGVYLPYDLVVDYLSEEFESDGLIRLFNNGNHPEMEAFVIWMVTGHRRAELENYFRIQNNMVRDYLRRHGCLDSNSLNINNLSTEIIDTLSRAEADPEYILDLTGLWEGCD